jgi:hypothetical protein
MKIICSIVPLMPRADSGSVCSCLCNYLFFFPFCVIFFLYLSALNGVMCSVLFGMLGCPMHRRHCWILSRSGHDGRKKFGVNVLRFQMKIKVDILTYYDVSPIRATFCVFGSCGEWTSVLSVVQKWRNWLPRWLSTWLCHVECLASMSAADIGLLPIH